MDGRRSRDQCHPARVAEWTRLGASRRNFYEEKFGRWMRCFSRKKADLFGQLAWTCCMIGGQMSRLTSHRHPPTPLQNPLRTRLRPPIRCRALCWIVNQSEWVLEINQVSNASPASCIVLVVLSSSDSCHASGIRWTKTDDNQRRISQRQSSQTSGEDGERQVSCAAAASGCWFIFTSPFQKQRSLAIS